MLIKSEYSIDKLQESQVKDMVDFRAYKQRDAAARLGLYLAEKIPYEKDSSRSWPEGRPIPDPFTTLYAGPAVDIYRCEFAVLTKPEWAALESAVGHIVADVLMMRFKPGQAIREIMQAIEYYASPNE